MGCFRGGPTAPATPGPRPPSPTREPRSHSEDARRRRFRLPPRAARLGDPWAITWSARPTGRGGSTHGPAPRPARSHADGRLESCPGGSGGAWPAPQARECEWRSRRRRAARPPPRAGPAPRSRPACVQRNTAQHGAAPGGRSMPVRTSSSVRRKEAAIRGRRSWSLHRPEQETRRRTQGGPAAGPAGAIPAESRRHGAPTRGADTGRRRGAPTRGADTGHRRGAPTRARSGTSPPVGSLGSKEPASPGPATPWRRLPSLPWPSPP